MRKQTKQWTTKTGRKIRICDMTNIHLLNTVRMLKRNARAYYENALASGYSLLSSLQGEMAQDHLESKLMSLESDDLLPDIYWNLLDECERRGIKCWKE